MSDSAIDDRRLVSSLTAPIVGRAQERALLHENLAAACSGSGSLVLLAGKAGIGKTTLLHDLGTAAASRGALVAGGNCVEAGGWSAFTPWVDVLAALPGSAILPPPFGTGAAAGSSYQLLTTIVAHLRNVAAQQPVVILLDDLHWADRDALALLQAIVRSLDSTPILIAGAYRNDPLSTHSPFGDLLPELRRSPHSMFLTVSSLSQASVSELVESRIGRCSEELASYLHARAEGHPLFLVEVLRDLSERRVLSLDVEGRLLPPEQEELLPTFLVHVITHRVSRLGVDVELLLQIAAVAGETWRHDVIDAALAWEEDRLLRALEVALQAELIRPVPGIDAYRFGHALIRQALYDHLSPRRRSGLHKRIARALIQLPGVLEDRHETLAYHSTAAGDWDAAAQHGLAAGDAARERLAGHSAVQAYQGALGAVAHCSGPAAVTMHLTLLERLGRMRFLLGDPPGAEADFQRMLEAARIAQDHSAVARALVWLSYAQRRQYHPHASRLTGEEALRVAEVVAEPEVLALAQWNLAHFHEVYGLPTDADKHARAAVDLARGAGATDVLSRSLQVRSVLGVWQGHYDMAADLARESLALDRQGHDGLTFAAAHWRLGVSQGEMGHYSEALRILTIGMEYVETIGERYYLTKFLNTLGWLHLEVGAPLLAREWDRRALETVRTTSFDRVTEAERYTLLNLASDELAAGDLPSAAAYLREFAPLRDQRDYARSRYLNRAQLVQADISLAQGDFVSALNVAQAAVRHATEHSMRKNLARAQLTMGRALLHLHRTQQGMTALKMGVDLADQLGHGRLRWLGRLWLGDALVAQRQDPSPIYHQADAHLRALAIALVEDTLREALLTSPEAVALQERLMTARPARERPAGLTERELDVLLLLMEYRTDREIAEALFLSHRTIGTHVANILGKLGVTNRRDAIAVASDLRLR